MKKLLQLSFKQVLLLSTAIVTLVYLWGYVNTYVYKSRAALGPNGVNVSFSNTGRSFPVNTNQTTTVTLSTVTNTNKISIYNFTFGALNNLEFVDFAPGLGFSQVTKELTNGNKTLHVVFTNSAETSRLPSSTLFTITFKGTAAGEGSIQIQDARVAGVISGGTSGFFELESNPQPATFTFTADGGGVPTPTDTPRPTRTPTPTFAPGQPTNTPVPAQPTNTPRPTRTPTPTPVPGQPTNTPVPGQPTSTPTPGGGGGTGQTGNVTLNLKLKLQGVLGKPQVGNSLPVKVKLAGPTNTGYQTGTFTADGNGVWTGSVSFSNVTAGSGYTVYVKGGKHVQKKVCVANPSETAGGTYRCSTGSINLSAGSNNLDFSKILMLAGDLTSAGVQDGVIDSYDTSFIINNLGKTDPAVLVIGDLNFDGVIDTQDRSLVIQSLNVKYDEE